MTTLLRLTHSKYGNRKTEVDGYTFDSKAEAARYGELRLLESAREISQLAVHPVYELLAPFTDARGRKHRRLSYEADFEYIERASGLTIIEDVKGALTREFRIKEKLLCHMLPERCEFRVVKS